MKKKLYKWIGFLTYSKKRYEGKNVKIEKSVYFICESIPFNAEFMKSQITYYDSFWNVFDRISHAVFHQFSPEVLQNTISIHIKKVEVKEFDISEFEKKVLAMNE